MTWNDDPTTPAECAGCSGCSRVGLSPGEGNAPHLTGWRLAGASAGIFLFPILTAAIGAGLAGAAGAAQLAGGVLGLTAGSATAWAITRRLQRTPEVGA